MGMSSGLGKTLDKGTSFVLNNNKSRSIINKSKQFILKIIITRKNKIHYLPPKNDLKLEIGLPASVEIPPINSLIILFALIKA